jgi:hypothetical protein
MKKRISYLLLALTGLVFYACKKSGGGTPVITHVRSLPANEADSFFVTAVPGNEIVIQGSNLQGAQAIYFNDTSAAFNPVYNTSTTIIVVIPASAPTAAINPNVTNTLKLVTSHGTVTTTFTLVNPPPYISSISFDNTGTIVYINGGNFEGISKITFPGNDTALGYTVNKAYNTISAIIPAGSGITDSLRVFCHYGTASFPFPPPMTISNISNENAVAGDTLVITGTNFVRVNNVTFPGGVVQTNVTTVNVGQILVVVPPGITTSDTLRINGILGTVGSSQLFDSYITHPSPGYLSTFDGDGAGDNTGFVGWTGGFAAAPATAYPGASGSVAFLTNGTAIPGQARPGSQGNAGFIQLNAVPWVANTSTPIAGYSLKFEVYVANPWSVGEIWIMMGGWYGWSGYLARFAPWTSATGGTYQPHGWVTVTMPLTAFVKTTGPGTSALVYGNVTSPVTDVNEWDYSTFPTGGPSANLFSDFNSTAICFTVTNDSGTTALGANAMNVAIDNVRIVKGQ